MDTLSQAITVIDNLRKKVRDWASAKGMDNRNQLLKLIEQEEQELAQLRTQFSETMWGSLRQVTTKKYPHLMYLFEGTPRPKIEEIRKFLGLSVDTQPLEDYDPDAE